MNIIYIIWLWLLLVVYRVWYKFITNLSPSNSMLIMGVIIAICSILFWWLNRPWQFTWRDMLWVLMISLSTFLIDYGYVKLTQLWYSSSILNTTTTMIWLIWAIVIFLVFFNDLVSIKQYIWFWLWIISLFLILYK